MDHHQHQQQGGSSSCGASEVVNEFCKSIEGRVLRKGSEEFNYSLGKRWNIDVVNSPLLIVYAKNVNDVVKSVNFARECEIELGIKAGGHGQKSVSRNGLLLDVSQMKSIKVDELNKSVVVEAGCTLGEFDAETAKYGLATPSGHVSHTGMAGLCLGGGIGHLSRSLGLTSDNLTQVTLVDYKGDIHIVNKDTNPELLFAVRGAGSNFGVVTEFTFNLHPVTNVYLGTFVYPHANAIEPLTQLAEFISHPDTPNELSCAISITPEGVVVMAIYNGTTEKGKPYIEKISSFGSPVVSKIDSVPYVQLQKLIDDKVPHGLKYYQRGPFIKTPLNRDIITTIMNGYESHPTKSCALLLTHLGGVVKKDNPESSFAHRNAEYQIIFLSIIPADQHKPAIIDWTNKIHNQLKSYCSGDYANTTDDTQPINLIYGRHTSRLIELKTIWDPTNFFRNNTNINPISHTPQ